MTKMEPERRELMFTLIARILIQLVGASLSFSVSFSHEHGPNALRALVIGNVLQLIGVTWWFLAERDRFWAVLAPVLAITNAIAIAEEAARSHSAPTKVLVAVVVTVLFVAPLPLLGVVFRRRQDEMQRSLATIAGAVAFASVLIATFGYYLLEQIVDAPQLSMGVPAAVGAGAFLVVWGLLRISIAR